MPISGYSADADKVVSSTKEFVKDSVITTKIKAKLAEEKLSSAVSIKVDTDSTGVVQLSGKAMSQADVDKAGSIARGVEGVVSVENNIQVTRARAPARAAKASRVERAEDRIKDMHARLEITHAQEEQWAKVAEAMRDNAQEMDALKKAREEKGAMNAVDDLKSFGEIASVHAEGIKKFTPIFEKLYDSMSDAQKTNADAIFRHGGRKGSRHYRR